MRLVAGHGCINKTKWDRLARLAMLCRRRQINVARGTLYAGRRWVGSQNERNRSMPRPPLFGTTAGLRHAR